MPGTITYTLLLLDPISFVILLATLFSAALFIGLPAFAIWTYHRRKMEELKIQQRVMVDRNIQSQLDAVRDEIKALRDTALQYDISFDTNLQQMERRLIALERQARAIAPEEATQPNVLFGGRS
jgi:hypothetical protein